MFDIREGKTVRVTEIRFADDVDGENATTVSHIPHEYNNNTSASGMVAISDDENGISVVIFSENDAENLIKALQKSIELKWFD